MRETYDGDLQVFDSRFKADQGVHARFYTKPVQDMVESDKQGRPIYSDKEWVEIVAAGNANNIVQRIATNQDRQRFQRQYEAYKAKSDTQEVGTPLEEVPWMSRSMIEELAYFRIRTLEVLANVDDNTCGRMPGLYDLKRKAKAHIESAEKSAPVTQLAHENQALRDEVNVLKQQVQELTSALKKTPKSG